MIKREEEKRRKRDKAMAMARARSVMNEFDEERSKGLSCSTWENFRHPRNRLGTVWIQSINMGVMSTQRPADINPSLPNPSVNKIVLQKKPC